MRRLVSAVLCGVVLAGCVALAGCDAPGPGPVTGSDEPSGAPTSGSPTPSTRRTSSRPVGPSRSGSSSGFGELTAVACGGRPTADQVISALRRASIIPATARPVATVGPLCAGTWQYTRLDLPEREPLHVVTSGRPEAVTVVTAGTSPCTPKVRANAPAGILTVLKC